MEVSEEFSNNLLDVLCLSNGRHTKVFFAVQVTASAVFQGFILKILFKCFLPVIMPVALYYVVQRCASKVSKQDGLTVSSR